VILPLVESLFGAPGLVTVSEIVGALAAVVRPRLRGSVGAMILDRILLLTPEGGESSCVEHSHGRILSGARSRCHRSRSRRPRRMEVLKVMSPTLRGGDHRRDAELLKRVKRVAWIATSVKNSPA
jgi:hypothetical protein